MKNKTYILKNALLLTLIAFLFGLTLFLTKEIFNLSNNNIVNYLYDLSASIFACSLLVFILSIKDYLSARGEFMKEFWAEANSVNNELKKINYIFLDIPNKLIVRNINKEEVDPKLRNYIYEYYKDSKLDELKDEELESHIELIISSEREKLLKDLTKELKNYIAVSKVSLSKLNYLVNDADFFRSITTKDNMHTFIYQPLYDVYKDIKNLASDIECNDIKEEGNLLLILDSIKNIQEKLFAEEYDKDRIKISYGLPYKIERALETWRSSIYHDQPIYEGNTIIKTVKPKTDEEKVRKIETEEDEENEKED